MKCWTNSFKQMPSKSLRSLLFHTNATILPQQKCHTLTSSKLDEVGLGTVEAVSIAAVCVRVGVLPEAPDSPATREGADCIGVVSKHQRVSGCKGVGVARARFPPRWAEVKHGPASGLAVISVAEVLDPRHHCARRQTPALAVALGFEIQHTGQGDSVSRPATAVGEEVLGLSSASRLAWMSEVVTTADQASSCGALILRREGRREIVSALGGLLSLLV